MNIPEIIIKMIWIMLPAYLSNPAAAIAIAATGQGRPIDFEKSFKGRRIFGDGKTFKGLFAGVSFGIFVALIENFLNKNFLNSSMPYFNYIAAITLSFGSLFGDLTASFFKRRLNFARGQAFPLVDQLDFVIGAWIITFIFATHWFKQYFTIDIIITALILTPVFHLLFNMIGYKLGISKEPW